MEKIDLTKLYRSYYTAKQSCEILEFGEVHYISITGSGDPSGSVFQNKIQALYPLAYGIKFYCKTFGKDFVVPKLEGLWWFDESKFKNLTVETAPTQVPRSEWEWRLLIRMPEFVDEAMIEKCRMQVLEKKSNSLIKEVEYFKLNEGKVIQVLHVGPFSEEPATLKIIDSFSKTRGLRKAGLHHEIYLSDFNRTAPEKLKTILREPVK